MRKRSKIMIAGMMACASVSLAGITTTFTGHPTDTTLRNLATITLNYTIDGSGNVTLDASTSNGGAVPTEIPDFWDGAAGTVSEESLWGTSFSLTGVSTAGGYIGSLGPNTGLGIQGAPSNTRIDNSGAEAMTWTYAGDGNLNITGLAYADRVANGASKWLLEDSDTSVVTDIKSNGVVAVDGVINLTGAGYSLVDGDTFTISSVLSDPAVDAAGASLAGFEFDLSAPTLEPGINVSFTNSVPIGTAPFSANTPGIITLDYTVDGGGLVTVDASCSATNPTIVAAVDEWDGAAGYVDFTNGVSFSVEVVSAGGTLRVSDVGSAGGLGVTGQNQWRIDRVNESVSVTLESLPGVAMQIKNVEWVNGQSATGQINLDASSGSISNALTSGDGSWNVFFDGVFANNDDALLFGVTTNIGYTLKGFEFNLVSEFVAPPTPGVDVEFSYADANMNFGTGESLSLDFSIDGSGVVSLDASTSNTNAAQIAAANAWDSSDVGFITNSALFGKTFSLVGTAQNELGPSAISLWSNDGGILGVSGQNAGRIDGANIPSGTNNLESLTWAMSGDVTVDFTAFSHGNTHPAGGIKLMDSDTTQLFDLSVLGTPVDLTGLGFSLGAGQSLVFSADTNYLEGAGIAGFSFDLSESQALTYAGWAAQYPTLTGGMTDDDDNDGLENLYEFAVGGNPTNSTVSPAYMPTSTLVDVGGSSNVLEYVYTRREPVPVDMEYYCEVDTVGLSIPSWTNDGYSVTGEANAAAGFKTVTNQVPVDANTQKFIKLVVEQE